MRGVSSIWRAVARHGTGALGSEARPAAAAAAALGGDGAAAAALRALTQLAGLQQPWQQQAGFASWRGKVPVDEEEEDLEDVERGRAHRVVRGRREQRIWQLLKAKEEEEEEPSITGAEAFVEG